MGKQQFPSKIAPAPAAVIGHQPIHIGPGWPLWFGVRLELPLSIAPGDSAAQEDEPRLKLRWPGGAPLAPGHYRLTIVLEGDVGSMAPLLLHATASSGSSGTEGKRLARGRQRSRLSGDFILPTGAASLQLAPGRGGESLAGRIRLRRLVRAEYYLRLAAGVIAARRRRRPLLPLVGRTLAVLAKSGPAGLGAELRRVGHGADFREDDYAAWIRTSERLADRLPALQERVERLEAQPLISVLMPVHDTPPAFLREAIESVRGQLYGNWELCIADDGSRRAGVRQMLEAAVAEDERVRLVFSEGQGGIAAATNAAFSLARGRWIALLDHDDRLAPHALAEMALAIATSPGASMFYSDEDKLSPAGVRVEPFFKPDFSCELFRSQNYLNHLAVYRADIVLLVGGWRSAFDGSQDYDLNLRIFERAGAAGIQHIPAVLYHWRIAAGSTATSAAAKQRAFGAGLEALRAHIARTGLEAMAEPAPAAPYYRLRPALPKERPLVSLIMPGRDRPDLLYRAVESIRRRTTYPNYEIILVDNGSTDPAALELLQQYEKNPAIRVRRDDRPFNFSALCNAAVATARGSVIGLINNDVEVISPEWLGEMVAWASQPGVGCVGAKLLDAGDRIQHAGVILGLGGIAGHSHKYFPREHPGYYHRLRLVQNVSAVTGACLLVRKNIYEGVGGLNENDLAIAFNDVDFCLKVSAAGYRNVWTPYAELYHLEGASRGADDDTDKRRRFNGEAAYMRRRWALEDPFYSPHLTREREDFSIALAPPGGSRRDA